MSHAIVAHGIGKRYMLQAARPRFVTLRDAIGQRATAAARRILRPFSSAPAASTIDEFWALQDVSFEVERAARIGVIGRNGAGKSTLLKILSRITRPTTGHATIRGRVASLLEVGTGFHPDLTGRENIFLNGAVLGMARREIQAKFDQIVAFAEVERFLDTPVKRYSSGMYVRLAFAVAAHLTPEILIVDEVLAVGDAEFQKKCLGVMQGVSRSEGRTIFFVSHNMAAVQALCTHAIHLDAGRVVASGPAREVIDQYIKRGIPGRLNETRLRGKHFELLDVSVRSPDASPLTTFGPAVFEVRFQPLVPVTDAGVHILVEDLAGAPILGLETTDFVQKVRAQAERPVTARFSIDSLPLNPGGFRMRIWLRSHSDHYHWEVPVTFELTVEETLVYGVRRIQREIHGAVAARTRVDVVPS